MSYKKFLKPSFYPFLGVIFLVSIIFAISIFTWFYQANKLKTTKLKNPQLDSQILDNNLDLSSFKSLLKPANNFSKKPAFSNSIKDKKQTSTSSNLDQKPSKTPLENSKEPSETENNTDTEIGNLFNRGNYEDYKDAYF
jgi:ribosome-binding ATPase YchF (GTP1/OBG family)